MRFRRRIGCSIHYFKAPPLCKQEPFKPGGTLRYSSSADDVQSVQLERAACDLTGIGDLNAYVVALFVNLWDHHIL